MPATASPSGFSRETPTFCAPPFSCSPPGTAPETRETTASALPTTASFPPEIEPITESFLSVIDSFILVLTSAL